MAFEVEQGELKDETPTQVLLTDWMQFLQRAMADRAGSRHRPRIGIVVSAWDAVPSDQTAAGPEQYLKDNFPLLLQFAESNSDRLEVQVFGLSVVSGDLKADEQFKVQYGVGNPHEFGFVVHYLNGAPLQEADVTIPIAWALGFLGTTSE